MRLTISRGEWQHIHDNTTLLKFGLTNQREKFARRVENQLIDRS